MSKPWFGYKRKVTWKLNIKDNPISVQNWGGLSSAAAFESHVGDSSSMHMIWSLLRNKNSRALDFTLQ